LPESAKDSVKLEMLKFDDKNEEAFKKMLRILKFKHRKNIMVSQLDKEIEDQINANFVKQVNQIEPEVDYRNLYEQEQDMHQPVGINSGVL
jgi:hypothetical protein